MIANEGTYQAPTIDDEFQADRPQRSSPPRRSAAYHSDIELVGRSQAFLEVMKEEDYSKEPGDTMTTETTPAPEPVNDDWVTLSEIEGRYVARVLEHTGGNKQAAARVLAIDRKTLDRMIKRHNIISPHSRQRAKASGIG